MFVKVEFVSRSRHWKLEVSKDITANQIVLPTKSYWGWAFDSAFHAKSICFRKTGKSFYRFNYRVCLLSTFTQFSCVNSELPWKWCVEIKSVLATASWIHYQQGYSHKPAMFCAWALPSCCVFMCHQQLISHHDIHFISHIFVINEIS